MDQQTKPLPPIALPRVDIVNEQAFASDLLGRKELAERLTGYLDRLREGAVLAIDAPWGEGKTWFGRNWAKYLEDAGHKVVFIDAFEQDYVEDPFLLIAAEITEVLDDGKETIQGLREKAAGVMKAILPVGTKALINLAGRLALGTVDLSEEIKDAAEAASDSTAEAANKWVEKKLEDHAQEKASLQHFRTALAQFATAQEKTVVLFIDELDRCQPIFAVRLIERVKHFFDVPNLVFVLLLNRPQLENAVKGVYGVETDATAYLGKFVNFFFLLPKRTSFEPIANDHIKAYVSHVFNRYNFEIGGEQGGFKDILHFMAGVFSMSLRDIERAVALYAFAQPNKVANHFLAYVISLKVAKPDLFRRLIKNEIKAHEEAKIFIDNVHQELKRDGKGEWPFLTSLSELHKAHISGFKEVGENLSQYTRDLWRHNLFLSVEQLFSFLAERIDLPMER